MLTEQEIKSLKPKDKTYRLYDTNNLVLEITKTGLKSWRIKTKTSFISLGHYPALSLKEARILASDYKSEVASYKKIYTFEIVALEWFDRQEFSKKHEQDTLYKLKTYIFPIFGQTDIASISRLEILEQVRKIETQGKLETCKKVIGIFRMIFDYAINCGYCENNPALRLQGAIKTAKVTPMAALTKPEDIKLLMQAIKNYKGQEVTKLLILWSAYTFARPSECRNAEWTEIDLENKLWIIPPARMKMKQEHVVPLPKQCLNILKRLRELNISNILLFPSLRPSKALSENAVLNALRTMDFSKEEMTAHGFRAMASTTLNNMGYRPDLIEKSLAHGDKDKVRSAYNRAAYLDERREMLQHYADWLDNL